MAVGFALLMVAGGVAVGLPSATWAPASPSAPVSNCPNLNLPTPICHVYVVMMENENSSTVLSGAPYELNLSTKYAYAADYYSYMHYSFPNYLIATSGVHTNAVRTLTATNLANLFQNHTPALSWATYMQGMPKACDQLSNIPPNGTGSYTSAHNPFVFYGDIVHNKTLCNTHDLTMGAWSKIVKTGNFSGGPTYAFFAPNITNDCHSATLAYCDHWLKTWLAPLIKDPFFNDTAWFITYDEGPDTDNASFWGQPGGGQVYMTAVSPYACKGYQSATNYSDFSLLTTTEWLLGLGHTGNSDNWSQNPPMKDLFCFPRSWHIPGGTLATVLGSSLELLARARPE